MKQLVRVLVILACVLSLTPGAASASPILGVTVTGGSTYANTGTWTLGYSFTASSAISVVGLGVYDYLGDGLLVAHDVGLWNASGTLLASATVPSGSGASLVNSFRFVTIPSVALTSGGLYYVGAVAFANDNEVWILDPSTLVTGAGITYDSRRYQFSSGSLVFPSLVGSGSTGYFGGNFQYETSGSVPEAGSSLLLLGMGLVGLRAWRKRA